VSTVAHQRRPDPQIAPQPAKLLELIAGDPIHERDRERIVASIHDDAAQHDGRISANRVRRALTNEHGRIVLPQLIGATYSCLARSGAIKVAGWEVSDDAAGHHQGTVIRTWRLAEGWLS
jgi:hypothetical protein